MNQNSTNSGIPVNSVRSDTALNALHTMLGLSTFLVIIRVILEGQEIWSEIKESGWRNLKHIWAKIGFVLLVVGLCLELFFQTKIKSVDAKLKRESDIEIAQLKKEEEEARAAIAEATARAAEANRIAEGERLARVKIEARLAPRSISPDETEYPRK